MVIPFDHIYPPMNGGMLRCFNLLNQLCKHFNVTALMHQDKESFLQSASEFPAIKNCNLLSTKDNEPAKGLISLIPSKFREPMQFRIWNRSMAEPTDSNYMLLYPKMKEFLQSNEVNCVILEDMAILSLAKLVRRFHPNVPVIYDAYNVNSVLSHTAMENGVIPQKEYEYILQAESTLFKKIDQVLTCSENDLKQLTRMNEGKISGMVIPNGVGIPEADTEYMDPKLGNQEILFCGSLDYFPNQEGLTWFCKEVFPFILNQLPNAKLLVVGKGDPGKNLSDLLKYKSIVNYGKVPSVDIYYRQAALAIVPLLSGSGTRLKLLESMALRTAVVSTSSGAEGINYIDGKNIMIADDAVCFADNVVMMLINPARAKEVALNAYELVKKNYDWNIIGKKLSNFILGLN